MSSVPSREGGVLSWIDSCPSFDGGTSVAERRGVGGVRVNDWRFKRSVLLPNSAKDWPTPRVGESDIEWGEVRTENLGDGVRGGARAEAGGLDELAGDSEGGEAAELCKDVAEAARPSCAWTPSLDGRLLETPPVTNIDVPVSGFGFAILAFWADSSLAPRVGETAVEATSVGVYALGGETGAGLVETGT